MFKFFFSLTLLVVLAASSYSDTLPAFDADKIFSGGELISTITVSADTLTDDSIVCFTDLKPSKTTIRNYVLAYPTILEVDTASDSVAYALILRAYAPDGTLMNEFLEDSIKAVTGKQILLHINRGVVGSKFDLVLKPNAAANGNTHILKNLWLWSVKPID